MVTANRIRLTGLLRRSPRIARASLLVDRHSRLRRRPHRTRPLPHSRRSWRRRWLERRADLRAGIARLDAEVGRRAAPASSCTALYEQRLYRLLARDPKLAAATMPALPAAAARDGPGSARCAPRALPADAAAALEHDDQGRVGRARSDAARVLPRRRSGGSAIPWNVLASVNFVESKFGKLRNSSAAGAQGPMQFMPATWRQYGLGGNVHDAHDAILGAANYLHASGAPRNIRPCAARVQPVRRIRRRSAPLREADARGPADVLRALQLAGLPQDARAATAASRGRALTVDQMLSSPTSVKPSRR